MNLKRSLIRTIALGCTLFLFIGNASGKNIYEKRTERYKNAWEKLIPTYQKIQYAGSMGFLSFGAGWDYGKHNCWETDLFVGFIPRFSSNRAKATLTLKQNYIPWHIPIGKSNWSIEPLACGLYINTILDSKFWVKEPERYPSNYYTFSTRIRSSVYLGQRFELELGKKHPNKSITFFYELSTNDLYIINAVNNKYLKPKDCLSLSFGVKFQIL